MQTKFSQEIFQRGVTVFCCVSIIVFGITLLSKADPITTSIGQDISTNNLSLSGSVTSGTWAGSSIDVAHGGTGQNWSAATQGSLPYFSGTGALSTLTPGTAGQFLQSGGDGANPSWGNGPAGATNVTRAATFTIAASDSSALSKQQADYVCDGTDDNVEIQAAIDACETMGFGKVVLLEGNFNGGKITIQKSNITLQGQGIATTYTAKNGLNDDIISVGAGALPEIHNVEIRNINIIGNKLNQTAGSGIKFNEYINNSIISDVRIQSCKEHGIEFFNTTSTLDTPYNDIINTTIYSCGGDGINVLKSHAITISNVISNFNTGSGIYLVSSNSFHFSDIWANNNLNGIYLYQTMNGVANNINIASSVNNGIKILGGGYSTFSNCVVEDTKGPAGVYLVTLTDSVNFYGCFFPYSDYDHIRLNGSNNCNFTNCIFGSASQHGNGSAVGVRIMGASTNNLFDGCVGWDKSKSGKLPNTFFLDAVDAGATPDHNIYNNLRLDGAYNTTMFSFLGSTNVVNQTNGWVTKNTGTATVTASGTSVVVTHGLATTPTSVILSPTTDTAGKRFWVSAKTATTFTITIDSAHTSDITFDWRAVVGEGN